MATFTDEKGNVLNFTRSFPAPKISLSDRDYFKAHVNDAKLKTFLSIPVQNKGNGKWFFYITRRIDSPDGSLLGLVLVGVSAEVFSSFYESVASNFGKGASLSLYRDDFTLMTRWPLKAELVGKPNPTSAVARMFNANPKLDQGEVFVDSPRATESNQTQRRLVAGKHVGVYPLVAAAVVTEERYLSNWRHSAIALGFVALLCCSAILAAASRLAKSSQASEEMRVAKEQAEVAKALSESASQAKALSKNNLNNSKD